MERFTLIFRFTKGLYFLDDEFILNGQSTSVGIQATRIYIKYSQNLY